MQRNLVVFTLNVWGIPLVSHDRTERIDAIGCLLSDGDYDLVALQEVWSEANYHTIKDRVKDTLPYSHYFYSGVFGSGLCVFSKFPIVNAFFHAWPVNGYVHRITHGDWFGGKGVGMTKILVDDMVVHFYVAHLHAEYDRNSDDYKAHRVVQAFDTAQFLENTRGSCAIQILAGDLNTEPGDLAYRVLIYEGNMVDSIAEDTPRKGTCECPYNSYTALTEKLSGEAGDGKRIDYILYRGGFKYEIDRLEYSLPLPVTMPGSSHSYSDHEAVTATLRITKRNQVVNPHTSYTLCSPSEVFQCGEDRPWEYKSAEQVDTIREAIILCNQSLVKIASSRTIYLTLALVLLCMLFTFLDVTAYYGLVSIYAVIKLLLTSLVMYFVFMGTIWSKMERNGILSGQVAMQTSLYNKYKNCP